MLVLIDGHALASDWVKREAALALDCRAALQRTYVLSIPLQDVGPHMKELDMTARKCCSSKPASAASQA